MTFVLLASYYLCGNPSRQHPLRYWAVPPKRFALAWVLREPRITTAIFGTTQPAHLAQNLAAAGLELPPEIIAKIERRADA